MAEVPLIWGQYSGECDVYLYFPSVKIKEKTQLLTRLLRLMRLICIL